MGAEDSEGEEMTKAKEILHKHLGPARMEDAINRLAKHIENGELMAATDPTAFLDAVTEKLEHTETQLQAFVAWTNTQQSGICGEVVLQGDDVFAKLCELGLVKL